MHMYLLMIIATNAIHATTVSSPTVFNLLSSMPNISYTLFKGATLVGPIRPSATQTEPSTDPTSMTGVQTNDIKDQRQRSFRADALLHQKLVH